MGTWKRWHLFVAGAILLLWWFGAWAATVAPEIEPQRWVIGNALAFLAGGAFGAALRTNPTRS